MKVHLHDEQFDGHPHAWCGRGQTAVTAWVFEATPPALRCRVCEREWFPCGQPTWHLVEAQRAQRLQEIADRVPGPPL